jgi:hypothetical protein
MSGITDEFRKAMSDWVELKVQLVEARKDMKVLNDREKELKQFIKNYMENQKIDNVNLKKGKVSLRKTNKKEGMTIKKVQDGLLIYFQQDEVRTEAAMNCIKDNLETSETSIISLTGIKNKDS